MTINSVNDYATTITTSSGYVMDITPPAGSTFTLGKLIICANSTSYGLIFRDVATLYSVVLNGTRIQNATKYAVDGTRPTHITFTANNIIINDPNDSNTAITFSAPIVQGGVNINGGSATIGITGSISNGAVFIAGAAGVTASVTNMTLNLQAVLAAATRLLVLKILRMP